MRLSGFGAFAQTAAFAVASLPRAASARDLAYRAPVGCPSKADVAAGLEARAPTGRDARIDVSAVKGGGFRGDVVLGDGEGRLARSVEARTCGAVVEALALVVALDRDEAVGEATLADMPDDLRAVLVLVEIEGLSVADLAASLEVPVGTGASRLRRAREAFTESARRVRARLEFTAIATGVSSTNTGVKGVER